MSETSSTPPLRIVRCPNCGGPSVYSADNPFRPFCSERCKNIDFGAWASESYRVEAKPTADDEEGLAEPPATPH
ncbi:MAG: hypothetical protein JWP52_2984 [Rhizobacter sp.]|jgi:endogenous inhibitor of DNA gyrase (YacG/DUF329 family)|nr:hypothetical protein [Rhizobacter sp.]